MRLKSFFLGSEFTPPHKLYTLGEEIANSITAVIGAALSVVGLTVLVFLSTLFGDVWRIVSFSIYGTTLVILYLASTLYHSLQHPRIKQILQIVDHASIYLLIAGTYTPFLLVSLHDAWGWTLLAVIWGMAFLGIGFKILFIQRYERLSALSYILMGWLSVIAVKELVAKLPTMGLIWLGAGGVFYTVGIIFLAWKKPYHHAIWHLFVLGGSICHFLAVTVLLNPSGSALLTH